MKKFLAIAFALIFVCATAVSIAAVTNDENETVVPAKGDVNKSGDIDMLDYILTKRAYFGTYKLSEEQEALADIDDSGALGMLDYILVKRMYFGTYTYGATIDEATTDEATIDEAK